jgi:glutamine amidotransferase-like uncharacterized protein
LCTGELSQKDTVGGGCCGERKRSDFLLVVSLLLPHMSFSSRKRAAANAAAAAESHPSSTSSRAIRVGIVHGGDAPTTAPPTDGAWGCDAECVSNEKLCFEGDARFALEDVFIRDIADDNNSHQALADLDVLIMPGGNDEHCGGPGQHAALGDAGLAAIRDAIRDRGMVYVGICAGAFLAANKGSRAVVLAPSVSLHDEKNFGWASVRGWVALDVPPSRYSKILASWWKRAVYYDDGPALVVDESTDETQVLATYKGKVKFEDSTERERAEKSYWPVARELIGKAAVTLTRCGKGKILLIGPHTECCGRPTRKALTDLIAVLATDEPS